MRLCRIAGKGTALDHTMPVISLSLIVAGSCSASLRVDDTSRFSCMSGRILQFRPFAEERAGGSIVRRPWCICQVVGSLAYGFTARL